MAATLKRRLTDGLDNLSAYPRLKMLSLRIKNPDIKIPEADYSRVAGFILRIVDEIPGVLADKKNRALEKLLVSCVSHHGVIEELKEQFRKEPKSLKEKVEIMAEMFVPRVNPKQKI